MDIQGTLFLSTLLESGGLVVLGVEGLDVIEGPSFSLRWEAAPETSELMDRLVEYFEGRQPIGILFGPQTSTLTAGRT